VKQITRINHVGLRVRDLESSRSFYEKLGFEFLGGPMGPEPVAIVEHPSGVNINFILNALNVGPQFRGINLQTSMQVDQLSEDQENKS